MREPFLADPDVTLYLGDAHEVLAEMPAESVDCCVTSPPYWGLRDYGEPGQLGLEATPEEYVARLVDVFREVRRVLADHGTVWLNLGDSYASSPPGNKGTPDETYASSGLAGARAGSRYMETLAASVGTKRNTVVGSLKPKDLVGIPWRVAFALQADGWYLRSDIVWSKPNPMPESVTDRPTKAHEYVFLLSKQARYFFDADAVREPSPPSALARAHLYKTPSPKEQVREASRAGQPGLSGAYGVGRNVRSVWEIATQPFPGAHFATFPEELVRRMILAGCPEWVCGTCGKPRERIVEREFVKTRGNAGPNISEDPAGYDKGSKMTHPLGYGRYDIETLGWSDCGHGDYRPGVVVDPFVGSGTTCLVARKHGRRSIGVDLNPDYLRMAARRLQQLSLLAEATG